MQITGISPDEFRLAVAKAGIFYGDNLKAEIGVEYTRKDGSCNRFRARVLPKQTGYQLYGRGDDLAPGQKYSPNVMSGMRRVNAVCWHVYRDVLVEVFDINPNAKVYTAYAKYLGREGFEKEYPKTAHRQIGSMMYPITPVELCDCQ